jgi:hypothetical protein
VKCQCRSCCWTPLLVLFLPRTAGWKCGEQKFSQSDYSQCVIPFVFFCEGTFVSPNKSQITNAVIFSCYDDNVHSRPFLSGSFSEMANTGRKEDSRSSSFVSWGHEESKGCFCSFSRVIIKHDLMVPNLAQAKTKMLTEEHYHSSYKSSAQIKYKYHKRQIDLATRKQW